MNMPTEYAGSRNCAPANRRAVFQRALLLLLLATANAQPSSPPAEALPPLNDPPTTDHLAGKFIWADLFTPIPESAARFYQEMFQWSSVTFHWDGHTHVILRHHGRPVAGLVQRPAGKGTPPGRWVGYVAVDDVARTLEQVKISGGKILAEARDFPRRGTQAICADNEGAPLGLLHSTSGDTEDYRPEVGDWIWAELVAHDPTKAATFYREVFGYQVTAPENPEVKDHVILKAGGFARAGIVPFKSGSETRAAWMGIIRVANVDAAALRATTLGGRVLVMPHVSHMGTRLAVLADPTGGAFGVTEFNSSTP